MLYSTLQPKAVRSNWMIPQYGQQYTPEKSQLELLKYDLLNAMKTSGNFSLRHAFIIHSLFDVEGFFQ